MTHDLRIVLDAIEQLADELPKHTPITLEVLVKKVIELGGNEQYAVKYFEKYSFKPNKLR